MKGPIHLGNNLQVPGCFKVMFFIERRTSCPFSNDTSLRWRSACFDCLPHAFSKHSLASFSTDCIRLANRVTAGKLSTSGLPVTPNRGCCALSMATAKPRAFGLSQPFKGFRTITPRAKQLFLRGCTVPWSTGLLVWCCSIPRAKGLFGWRP